MRGAPRLGGIEGSWAKYAVGTIGVVVEFIFLGNVVLNWRLAKQNMAVYALFFLFGIFLTSILMCPRDQFRKVRRSTEGRAP